MVDDLGWVRASSAQCRAHAHQTSVLRLFFCLLVLSAGSGSASLSPGRQKKLTGGILAAQHNVGWHNKDMKTPNADALVKEGIQLDKSCAPNFRSGLSPSARAWPA